MTPAETTGVFALAGAVIGFIAASIGTLATLRQQHNIWKKERKLEELRNRRDEIRHMVEDLGILELNLKSKSVIIPDDASGRAILYKLQLYSDQVGISMLTSSMDSLFAFQKSFKHDLEIIEKQIDELLIN